MFEFALFYVFSVWKLDFYLKTFDLRTNVLKFSVKIIFSTCTHASNISDTDFRCQKFILTPPLEMCSFVWTILKKTFMAFWFQSELDACLSTYNQALVASGDQREIQLICLHEIGDYASEILFCQAFLEDWSTMRIHWI